MTTTTTVEYDRWTRGDTGWTVVYGALAFFQLTLMLFSATPWLSVFLTLFTLYLGAIVVQGGRRRRYNEAVNNTFCDRIEYDGFAEAYSQFYENLDTRLWSIRNPGKS